MKTVAGVLGILLAAALTHAAEPATITANEHAWGLRNESLQATVSFAGGKLALTSLENRAAKTDYLKGRAPVPLFSFVMEGKTVTADDGGWSLAKADVTDIDLYGITWGRRLDVTLTRSQPVAFSVRQIFEVYNDRAGLRCLAFVKNGTDKPLTISASDVLALNLPDDPHQLYHITDICDWNVTDSGLAKGGRNAIACYGTGDGWFVVPENNWATCLSAGRCKGDQKNKLLGIYAWDNHEAKVRVASNPVAVQVTLFPREELEYFSVNFGVFKGEILDGRVAVSQHLRKRYKFHDPSHILSVNDWQWGSFVPLNKNGFNINTYQQARTDQKYREVVVPQAKAAGFDRVLIDDGWYSPDDSTTPTRNWADLASLGQFIEDNGMKSGYWFSLQARFCCRAFGQGLDCANPTNLAHRMQQLNDDLIGKYHCTWDQVDSGPLFYTPQETAWSHPKDSVYRKVLAMRKFMNETAHKHPDFIMQTTCEIDNPSGYAGADHSKMGNQNVGLIHLADNGITGFFGRTKYFDNVREIFASVGLFPPEGLLSTFGEDQINHNSWADSPMWYYQFLLARHSMVYSYPGTWSKESVGHLRTFNNWRKNPRIKSVLNEVMHPVYNGKDWMKNEGPWCWMYTDEKKTQALVFAINHRELNTNNAFDAKLRWLDEAKTYLIEEITQLPDGTSGYNYRGEFTGAQLKEKGLPIDLDAGEERCGAFFVQEKRSQDPQVLYADSAVVTLSEAMHEGRLAVQVEGRSNATAQVIVCKPGRNGVEVRSVTLDQQGRGTASFDATTITQGPVVRTRMPAKAAPEFARWAATPPMGWNSYTSFGGSVTEAEVLSNAAAMKEKLLAFGWEYMVVDFRWYDPDAIKCGQEGSRRKGDWPLVMDSFGRLLPDPVRFPSAAGGKGFKPLADKLHGMGLKFGIHIMRGIPRQAVRANLPIEGSAFKAAEAAATKSLCNWCNDMFGVTNNAAGQAYYDSLFRLYATWDLDFVKVDDLTFPYSTHEVEMVRKAIDKCGRKIVFSTSPGATPVNQADHVAALANMWRVSPDFWDNWKQLKGHFNLAKSWEGKIGGGHWPDLDLLILGHVGARSVDGPRMTRFTRDEQRLLMTLWSIARSPLMIGSDLPKNDTFTDSLFMNKEVLAVNQNSVDNRQLYRRGDDVAWIAGEPGSNARYVALFNLGPAAKALTVTLKDAGFEGACSVRDLWTGTVLGSFTGDFKATIPAHGAGLYRVTP